MNTDIHFLSYLAEFFLEREMFQTKVSEKIQKTNFIFSTFFSENCAVCDVLWRNTVQPDRPHNTIWRMRVACCVP